MKEVYKVLDTQVTKARKEMQKALMQYETMEASCVAKGFDINTEALWQVYIQKKAMHEAANKVAIDYFNSNF